MKKTTLAITAIALMAAPARAEDKHTSAMKLSTLALYVKKSCVGLEPNYMMIGAAIKAMDVDTADLTTQARLRQANLILQVWANGGDKTCAAAKQLFGPKGTDLPGLFEVD